MTACSFCRLKTQAAMPTAKGPEPKAVRVITLKVFQIPQAYISFMPEKGPSGEKNRTMARTRPIVAKAAKKMSVGVTSGSRNTGTPRRPWVVRGLPGVSSGRTDRGGIGGDSQIQAG